MKAVWVLVIATALFPWWAVPVTAWLVPLPWVEAARVVTTTVAVLWTPLVLLAALLLADKAEGRA